MRTFVTNIFSTIQNYSRRLDDLSLLTNQHWVSIDEIMSSKTVYIFRSNNELIISVNGIAERAKWEYLGHKSLLIEKREDNYVFTLAFHDDNVLGLKLDGSEEYAIFVTKDKYEAELNSVDRVLEFLQKEYVNPSITTNPLGTFRTNKGEISVELNFTDAYPAINNRVYQGERIAENGKYKLGAMNYIVVHDGIIIDFTML